MKKVLIIALLYQCSLSAQLVQFPMLANGQAGEAFTAPAWVYPNSGTKRLMKADADVDTMTAVGVSFITATTAGDFVQVYFSGMSIEWPTALQVGKSYYLSSTAGQMTATIPTSGSYQRLGYAQDSFTFIISISPRIAISGGGGISDGSKGDITVSDAGGTWTIANDAVTAAKIAANAVGSSELESTTVTAATYGSATQVPVFAVDADGRITSVTNTTITGGAGDIINGGNTTGATVLIGTNDANALSFETNGVVRQTIAGAATTGGAITQTVVTANTATVQEALTIQANSTGTTADNFGAGLLFELETTTTDNQDAAQISAKWGTATHASRTGNLGISLVNNAGALVEQFNFSPGSGLRIFSSAGASAASYLNTGITTATAFTIGNSNQALSFGGGSGTISLTSSSSNAQAILLSASNNLAGAGIRIGISTFNTTLGTRNGVLFSNTFAPTIGTGIFNEVQISTTINQTGTSSGISRNVYFNPTLTRTIDFRTLEIAADGTNVDGTARKAIYQTGTTAVNNLVGKSAFGSTTVPTSNVTITGTNGYTQLRLVTQYTPTGSADANGAAGDVSVDDNYIYFKASTGWKRVALSTF